MRTLILALLFAGGVARLAQAQEDAPTTEPPMTLDRMAQIVMALDPEAKQMGPAFELSIDDVPILIITDPRADRMRAMVPIRLAEDIDAAEWQRLMQANFDSALDARYAVAQGRLWAVFIHPLSPLERDQFISGIGQTVNVAQTPDLWIALHRRGDAVRGRRFRSVTAPADRPVVGKGRRNLGHAWAAIGPDRSLRH
ncbi:hypothetical protein [Sulfitobacter sp. JL08]|uniref:hypothetical protein n=1 Tax=Sulfitobacter sp. JL08 TaxID=2070369 RepID=UPI0020C7AFA1|nr:hypothetical protein [Sulfitobacter sp. JL08]